MSRLLLAFLVISLPGPACWSGRTPPGDLIPRPGVALDLDVPDPRVAEAALAEGEVTADDVVAAVLATSPELAELRARARAELAEVRAESALPPPMLEAGMEGAPLERPWAYDEAEMIMIGIRQELPAFGRRDALARAAIADAEVAAAAVGAREAELAGRARRAHAAWYLAAREVALHDEHLGLVHAMVEAITAAYRANRARAEDVTRVEITVAQLHLERIAAEERLASARAMVNALTGREVDAPLGAPAAPAPRLDELAAAELASTQDRARAELRAAEAAVKREAARRDAERAAARPRYMIGGFYNYMPMSHEHQHGYQLMFSMTLPWLDGGRSARADAAGHREDAERAAGDATRAALRFELADALSRLRSARARLTSLRDDQLPRAERLYEATRVSFSTSSGDASAVLAALDGWLTTRLALEQALADVVAAEADVERAVGTATGGAR